MEQLPIPKLLNSYVICDKGILTSHEAFDEMAKHSKKSILAQVPSIKDMGRTFISKLPKLSSRIIIQEFDANDEKYVDLLSALLQRGVEIRTLPLVNSLNLVDDDSYALIISNAVDEDSMEYGAVYNDSESIENIKAIFESSWEIAKDLEL